MIINFIDIIYGCIYVCVCVSGLVVPAVDTYYSTHHPEWDSEPGRMSEWVSVREGSFHTKREIIEWDMPLGKMYPTSVDGQLSATIYYGTVFSP